MGVLKSREKCLSGLVSVETEGEQLEEFAQMVADGKRGFGS